MVAEQVIQFDPNEAKDPRTRMCIEAAQFDLESGELDAGLPENESAIHVNRMDGNNFTGCTVWFLDIQSAKRIGLEMLSAIQELAEIFIEGRPGSSNDPPPVFQFQ